MVKAQAPDSELYAPWYSPWRAPGDFQDIFLEGEPWGLVTIDRCYVLYTLGRQALGLPGDFWECGVYRGGTAIMLNRLLDRFEPHGSRVLHIFDTFSGMPTADPGKDFHTAGDFKDTSAAAVLGRLPNKKRVSTHVGVMPTTFQGLVDSSIALAHVDVDLYQSVMDCCDFIYPRVVPGGFMVFDDYGFQECRGARLAVDEYFEDKKEFPLVLQTGQAIVCKLG